MKILLAMPRSRHIPMVLDALMDAISASSHTVDLHFEHGYDDPSTHRYNNITRKYRTIRREFLDGKADALLTIEDDILVPRHAVDLLAAVEADVVYGLTVWRNAPHYSSAQLRLDPMGVLNFAPDIIRHEWGKPIAVQGCGLFCTLIHRRVLEVIDFRRDGEACCDWDFAEDCIAHGVIQMAHLGVVCGHVSGNAADADSGCVYWPINTAPYWKAAHA